MSRNAATLKKTEQSGARLQPDQPRLRLVSPEDLRKSPAQAKIRSRKKLQQDPLEEPTRSHCGLCATKIEGRAVTELRTSGRNMKAQTWFYHEVCWKQLERMRRLDHSWHSQQAINPEIRYSAASSGLDSIGCSAETLTLITG